MLEPLHTTKTLICLKILHADFKRFNTIIYLYCMCVKVQHLYRAVSKDLIAHALLWRVFFWNNYFVFITARWMVCHTVVCHGRSPHTPHPALPSLPSLPYARTISCLTISSVNCCVQIMSPLNDLMYNTLHTYEPVWIEKFKRRY